MTAFLSKKSRNVPVLIAKLMFSGMLPVMFATLSASSFSATTPTTLPLVSSNGPPLGCLGIEAEAEKLSGEVATPEDLAAAGREAFPDPASVQDEGVGGWAYANEDYRDVWKVPAAPEAMHRAPH